MPPRNEADHTQYEFILSSVNGRGSNPLASNDPATNRFLLIVGGIIILIISIWVLILVVPKLNSFDSRPLLTLAQEQTELARISTQPAMSARNRSTQNFAITTELSLLTDQEAFVNFLGKHGTKPSDSLLKATQSTKTDDMLKAAMASGSYDQTFLSIAQSQLTVYQGGLKQAQANVKDPSEKQLLNNAADHAQLLVILSNTP